MRWRASLHHLIVVSLYDGFFFVDCYSSILFLFVPARYRGWPKKNWLCLLGIWQWDTEFFAQLDLVLLELLQLLLHRCTRHLDLDGGADEFPPLGFESVKRVCHVQLRKKSERREKKKKKKVRSASYKYFCSFHVWRLSLSLSFLLPDLSSSAYSAP